MLIVDAHLDLSYNATRGRDPRRPAVEQPAVENEIATVGLPDLRRGGVALVCATIFCSPASYHGDGYKSAEEARSLALAQLSTYRSWIDEGLLRFIKNRSELSAVREGDATTNAIFLLEGADALRSADDVAEWFDAGLRIVGLAWRRTRAAGGTGEPGGLSEEGRALVRAFDKIGVLHDASHLAEQAFWELCDLTTRPILASHSNCRAIVPSDRQMSDEMIRAIAARGGVVGINFYDKFLLPPGEAGKRRATLADVVRHMKHVCDLAGSANHVGIGTDMDGGLGREQIPVEIQTSADLPRVAEALSAGGFGDEDVVKIMSGNWIRFFGANLPQN